MFDYEPNNNQNNNQNNGEDFEYSHEYSDGFDEPDESISWMSDQESNVNNWRGWRKQSGESQQRQLMKHLHHDQSNSKGVMGGSNNILSLKELAAKEIAASLPFELVETYHPTGMYHPPGTYHHTPVPEHLQLRIAFWSFPDDEEDIRMYSCLATGSAEEFNKGENWYRNNCVREPLQIGFHLSATTVTGKVEHHTSVTFDRKKIVTCQCSCNSNAEWCAHVVALCLHRIHRPSSVRCCVPVRESLARLDRDQLRKLTQYLIAKSPEQILPVAQNIIDELLEAQTDINTVQGAPDPTLGGAVNDIAAWCLEARNLKDNIRKILVKFCIPAPIVFSDVHGLSTTAPPSASEWCSFLRPLRGREPEGMWNLLSIVREMYKRNDRNSIPLLEIVTQQCLETNQIMVWWFNTKVALQQKNHGKHNVNSNIQASQHACASLCDEIVTLWKLAALNPCIAPKERETLRQRLIDYHMTVIDKVAWWNQGSSNNNMAVSNGNRGQSAQKPNKPSDLELFPGFKLAIEACSLDWSDYPIPGVTFGSNARYLCPFAVFKLKQDDTPIQHSQVNSSQAVLNCEYPSRPRSGEQVLLKEAAEPEVKPEVLDQKQEQQPQQEALSNEEASDEGVDNDEPGEVKNSERRSELEGENEADEVKAEENKSNEEPNPQHQLLRASSQDDGDARAQNGEDYPADNNDQYRVYFYDPKLPMTHREAPQSAQENQKNSKLDVFKNLRRTLDDPFEVLFMRAEGIHAHGYHTEACQMAVHLAKDLLRNPPDLINPILAHNRNASNNPTNLDSKDNSSSTKESLSSSSSKADLAEASTNNPLASSTGAISKNMPSKSHHKKSIKAASHQVTHTTSVTLAHCAFLCTVLSENRKYHNLAFQIGMFGLELARPPASTKPMEVKLAHQESELSTLLKKIPLGAAEMSVLRERAIQLRDGTLKSRGEALLPLILAGYVFESLVMASNEDYAFRNPADEQLGFEAAVAAIGLKASVSEADHPLLCEGTRRHRGDLTLTLLTHYKDSPEKVAKIMERLLDREIHPQFKSPILPTYYITGNSSSSNGAQQNQTQQRNNNMANNPNHHMDASMARLVMENLRLGGNPPPLHLPPPPPHTQQPGGHQSNVRWASREPGSGGASGTEWSWNSYDGNESSRRSSGANLGERKTENENHSSGLLRPSMGANPGGAGAQGPGSDSGSSGNSSGADSIDSSSTSSRQQSSSQWPRHMPNGANGISSNNFPPSNPLMENFLASVNAANNNILSTSNMSMAYGGNSTNAAVLANAQQQQQGYRSMEMTNLTRSTLPNIKVNRFKGKRQYPSIPNQPSEASAHFMFELAKTVLTKAGGNSSTTSLFTQATGNQNIRLPHRALQMCAFQIGLYALGLNNRVSPNWLSRTYSSHVSWITAQAMELGAAALSFLIGTWECHLTPTEAVSLADKASKVRDAAMVRSGAALALSVLPHSAALNPNEIQRAIQQCKEQRDEMLEKACEAVETAGTGGGVYPEVLFQVARHWHELFKKHHPNQEEIPQQQQQHLMPNLQSQEQQSIGSDNGTSQQQAANVLLSVNNVQVNSSNFPPWSLQLPFPVYSFVPGFPPNSFAAANAAASPLMFVTPPPQNALNSHFNNLQPRFGQVFQLGLAAPLLPAPPPTNPLQAVHHNAALAQAVLAQHQQQAAPQANPGPVQGAVTAAGGVQGGQVQQATQKYLLSSYRVGMLALENLGKRINEDRPQAKFAKTTTYGDDVKWLHMISQKLGLHYVEKFLVFVTNTIVSPFILQDLVWECGTFLASTASGLPQSNIQHSSVLHQIRTQTQLTQLLTRCCHMYYQCLVQRLFHIAPNDYDEFISILMNAKQTFLWAVDGLASFNTLLHAIKKNKSCKKDLWQKIDCSLKSTS